MLRVNDNRFAGDSRGSLNISVVSAWAKRLSRRILAGLNQSWSMTIILKPEQERILIDAINSGLAHTTAEALNQELEALRGRQPEPPRGTEVQSNEERARAFEEWARNHPKRPPLPDAAFQRENMIRDAR
jgi:hypothetical protein